MEGEKAIKLDVGVDGEVDEKVARVRRGKA